MSTTHKYYAAFYGNNGALVPFAYDADILDINTAKEYAKGHDGWTIIEDEKSETGRLLLDFCRAGGGASPRLTQRVKDHIKELYSID